MTFYRLAKLVLVVFLQISFLLGILLANEEYDLNNNIIKLKFNERGLISIEDINLNKTFKLTKDNFYLTIDGKVIQNEEMTLVKISKNKVLLTYIYESPSFVVDVVYELKSYWHFVSKQIFINSKLNKDFHVENIKIFDVGLDESVASEYIPKTKRHEFKTADYGVFLRFEDATGMFMLVQNPFLKYSRYQSDFSIEYKSDMDWKAEYGPFPSDRGCIGTYALTGQRVPAKLIPEWKWTNGIVPITDEEQDWAEVEAFTECVEAFILPHPQKSVKMNAAWCENDYQIDVANTKGREEYKRIIDRSAELGMNYILYAPTNSLLGSRAETMDDWNWENLLWLGLGIKIRKGEWHPEIDMIPESVQEMLDYAKSKSIKLVAYMYPVMPFSGNSEWIVEGTKYHRKKRNASLGVRSFQDYLINLLSQFYEKTGIGGYAYDYTFLWYEGTSRYAQWWGWRRVKETLRTKYPEIVIDGRQLDMCYGPWIWLSGSYPHPTAADEQPESFNPFPDLHFDRVSGNRQRFTAYRYRVNDYCPAEIMPGFITHQTSRCDGDDNKVGKIVLRLDSFRTRDWDYLGWKYSLISSIGTGGLNNIVSMIPARDLEEYQHFSDEDKKFFRDWIKWTDKNQKYLLNTRPIIGQPAIGRVDGTSAIVDNKGYIFLYNPNGRKMKAEFNLDQSIGLSKKGKYEISEIYPVKGKKLGKTGVGFWSHGDKFELLMDGASALVLVLKPAPEKVTTPLLFNVPGKAELFGKTLRLSDVTGEVGTKVDVLVLLPEVKEVKKLYVNGQKIDYYQTENILSTSLTFDGAIFGHMQQVGEYDPEFTGGTICETIIIPKRIFSQLENRKEAWPISWTEEDYKTTWLVPERLLLFVQIAEVREDMEARLKINGKPVELTKAYTSIRVHSRCFVGFYADVSDLKPGKKYEMQFSLPKLRPGQFQGLFFENIETEFTGQIKR